MLNERIANRISVVIPTYNSERFLPDLLDALNRLDEQPDEYIVVDGNSTDRTSEMLNRMLPRIRKKIIYLEAKGVYNAWNEGVKAASGEWIWIVCSDDLVFSNSIKAIRESVELADSSVGFISWNIDVISESGERRFCLKDNSPIREIDPRFIDSVNIRSAALESALVFLYRGYFVSYMSHVFRRNIWLEMPFEEDSGPSADIAWTLKAHLRGWAKVQIPGTLAAWRIQSESLTATNRPMQRLLAHGRLRCECMDQFAKLLELSPRERIAWECASPAHDAYDWFSVFRESKGFREGLKAIQGIFRCAGFFGVLQLAARYLWIWRGCKFERPSRQFRELFTDKRTRDSVRWL